MKKSNSSKPRKVRETKIKYRVSTGKESGMTLMEQIQNSLSKLPPQKRREVLDFITSLQLHSRKLPGATAEIKRGERIKELLTRISAMNVFSDISDPVEWQRNLRKDRPLPGRVA